MKKLSALIISLIMIVIIITPLCSYAGVKTAEYDTDNYETNIAVQSNIGLKSAIYDDLINCNKQIDISSLSVSLSNINDLVNEYYDILHNSPELFYTDYGFSYDYNSVTNIITVIYPKYTMEKSEVKTARTVYENGIDRAVKLIDDDMTDVQKALVIHDYLCNIARYPKLVYDSNNNLTNDDSSYHNAYGMFSTGVVVCEGYTQAFSAIMNKLGIESKYVSSSSMNHAWNVVKIDGEWYNADLTFDDPILDQENNSSTYGIFTHNNFLKSDAKFRTSDCNSHTGMIYPDGVSCTSNKYDDYFWDTIIGFIGVHNKEYYYTDFTKNSSSSLSNLNVLKRDEKGNTEIFNNDTYYTFVGSLGNLDMPMAKLVQYQGKFYLSHSRITQKNSNYVLESCISVINYDKSAYDFDKFTSTLNSVDTYFSLGIIDGDLGYLTLKDINNGNYTYHTYSRTERFENLYENDNYDSYDDVNSDGVINSKDYTYIQKGEYLL